MIVHLIDGTYELFRHFYGLRRFNKGEDAPYGAVIGVLNTVLQMAETGATHLGVATDHVIESFRNDLYPAYKTGEGMDRALVKQFHPLEDALAAMGVAVWPDAQLDYPGPLAGFLAGLEHCETPYLLTVPCDSPNFPADLAQRLAQALVTEQAEVAIAATLEDGRIQAQPVFCLMSSALLESLVAYTHAGHAKIDRWTASHRCATVVFEDGAAFANANTLEELRGLQAG